MKKWCTAVTVIVASLCLLSPFVHAQGNWPTKPVKIIVPYPPGGKGTMILTGFIGQVPCA